MNKLTGKRETLKKFAKIQKYSGEHEKKSWPNLSKKQQMSLVIAGISAMSFVGGLGISKISQKEKEETGTILVKGSGDKLIYLNRDRKGRWLKDFNNYTIRDSKRNIISQGKADSEEELINKLNEYLSKNKIKLEV